MTVPHRIAACPKPIEEAKANVRDRKKPGRADKKMRSDFSVKQIADVDDEDDDDTFL